MSLIQLLLLIIAGQLVALAVGYFSVPLWIKLDTKAFDVNPADDTFHDKFHRQRLTWRLGIDAGVALICSLPWLLLVNRPEHGPLGFAFLFSAISLFVLMLCYFFYAFNPGLNLARSKGRPDITEYYVSPDPQASWFPDRFIWNQALKLFPVETNVTPEELIRLRQVYASNTLENMGHTIINSGLLVYCIGTILAFVTAF
jgi:hypothetical protein